ncbi:MAG: hypothetical protein ACLQOO_20370 [Terriglobia bacterium]
MKVSSWDVSASPDIFTPALIYALATVAGFASGAYKAHGIEPSMAFRFLTYVGFLALMSYWVQKDSSRSAVWRVFDLGFFMYLLWPVIVPYYLIKTRGPKGLLPIIGFIGAYFVAGILGYVIL